ncbi:hypothetical protein MRX96_018294 [Rhipicephalus microplus]
MCSAPKLCVGVCARYSLPCAPRAATSLSCSPCRAPYTTDFTADKWGLYREATGARRFIGASAGGALFLPSAVVAFVRRRMRLSRRGAPVPRPEFGPSVHARIAR